MNFGHKNRETEIYSHQEDSSFFNKKKLQGFGVQLVDMSQFANGSKKWSFAGTHLLFPVAFTGGNTAGTFQKTIKT